MAVSGSLVSHRRGPNSRPNQFMLDLWWTKWYWDRLLSKSFGFPLTIPFHHSSPYSHFIWSMAVAAVQRHSLTLSTWTIHSINSFWSTQAIPDIYFHKKGIHFVENVVPFEDDCVVSQRLLPLEWGWPRATCSTRSAHQSACTTSCVIIYHRRHHHNLLVLLSMYQPQRKEPSQ
jgi:hypothetical protein